MRTSPNAQHAVVGFLLAGFLTATTAWTSARGAPSVSPQVEKLLHVLFRSPELEAGKLSPTGRYLAVLREYKGRKVLGTLNLETNQVYSAGGGLEQDIMDFQWCGPEQLIFQLGQEKKYYLGLWLANPTLKPLVQVKTNKQVLVVLDPLPQKSGHPLLVERKPGEIFSQLYRLNAAGNEVEVAEPNPGGVVQWLTDATGWPRFAFRALQNNHADLLYRDDDFPGWKSISLPPKSFPLAFDQTGRYLLLSVEGEDSLHRVKTFDLNARELEGKDLSDPAYDILPSVLRDPNTGIPNGLAYETSRPQIYWLNRAYAQLQARLAPAFPGQVVQPIGTIYSGEVLFVVNSDLKPPTYYLLNPKTGRARFFLTVLPEASDLEWAPMREVNYVARDGYGLHGYLTLPRGRRDGQKVPLIALSHGGPLERDNWGFNTEVQFLAALGYGVLQVNYRGSEGFGHAHVLKNLIEVGHRSVDDVADGLNWAVAQGYADPKRLVVMGGSYGGYISMALALRYPELPAAVVSFAGVYDWKLEIQRDATRNSEYYTWLNEYYPNYKTSAREYDEISPLYFAAKDRAPVLLLHGYEDRRVDIEQSQLMQRALRKAGKSVQLVKDANGIHGLPDEKSRITYYQTVAAFLLEHVPPDAAP